MSENNENQNMDCVAEELGDQATTQSTVETAESLESLRQQLRDAENKALRYQADLENFRRRTRREVEEQLRYANLPLMTELLELLDNLQRAVGSSSGDTAGDSVIQGVRMVATQFAEILRQHGCTSIEASGQKYDPNRHQAVQMLPHAEIPADHVIQELRPGYILHDRVIRPAQVSVSTGPNSSTDHKE